MGLLFSEDFTGATGVGDTDFDGEGGTAFTYTSGVMRVDGSVAWNTGYVTIDSALSQYIRPSQKTLHMKWDVTLDNATVGSNDLISSLFLYKGATIVLQLQYRNVGAGSECDRIRLVYDDTVAGDNQLLDSSAIVVNDATAHTIEVELIMSSTPNKADGSIRVWFDDTLVIDDQSIYWKDEYFDEIRFGANAVTFAGTVTTVDYDNIQLANNRTFTTQAETFYIDNSSGDRTNLGTSSSPFRDIDQLCDALQAGDTAYMVNNGATAPYRSTDGEGNNKFYLGRDGTASSFVTVNGQGSYITQTINATEGGDFGWTESSTSGEYYLRTSGDANPAFPEKPNFIAKALTTVWNTSGVDGLDVTATEGTVGSLNAGEWDYGDNDTLGYSTIYYRPASGETISTVHFEIPYGNSATVTDVAVRLNTDYFNVSNLKTTLANNHGFEMDSGCVGAYLTGCEGYRCWVRGFKDNSAVRMDNCKAHDNLQPGESGGFVFTDGVSGLKTRLFAYDNYDDGFEVGCTDGNTCDVTLSGCVSKDNGSTSTDGFGFEVSMAATAGGQTARLYNCVSDSNDNGFHVIMPLGAANTVEIKNCGGINNRNYGINDTSAAGTTTYSTNGWYGNTTSATNGANYDDNGDVTTDPGVTIDSDGNYTLSSSSSWVGTGSNVGVGYIGKDGEPVSNWDADIGSVQSQYGPFHPTKL